MLDLRILNVRLLDGTGAPPRNTDIGIAGDTIAALGDLSRAASRETLDLPGPPSRRDGSPARPVPDTHPGLCAAPGFIDPHSHSDTYLLLEPAAPSKLFQGITTEVLGNCGASAAPIETPDQLPADWAAFAYPGAWRSMAEYRALLDQARPGPNAVLLVGHNTLRRSVVGYDNRPAAPAERERMAARLEQSLDAGARGLSTGLIYAPGSFAPRDELVALAAIAARRDGIYTSHMRSEGARLLEAIDETLAVGRAAGIRVQISHLKTAGRANWGRLDAALARLRAARDAGLPVAADRYPYTRGATDLDVVLPAWAHEGGREATLARLRDPGERRRIHRALCAARAEADWHGVTIGSTVHPDNRPFRGLTLVAAAERLGTDPAEAVLRLVARDGLKTQAFFAGMSEANMRRILAEPYVMLCTDASLRAPAGPLSHDFPHPRAYGSFPRFLRMALDGGTVPLPEAVRKMTALPAAQFRLEDRGVVAVGRKADLVVFDPDTVRDTATYADPHRTAEGIRHVIVNGVLTLRDGALTGRRAGRVL
ncbi:MAG: D-aminoacylase [Lentisphaerae bacterium]|nr:D-aminoacylase [Lentisphaerota bacterium]